MVGNEGHSVLNTGTVPMDQPIELTDMSPGGECKFQVLCIDMGTVFTSYLILPSMFYSVPDNLFCLDHRSFIGPTLEYSSFTFCVLVDKAIV